MTKLDRTSTISALVKLAPQVVRYAGAGGVAAVVDIGTFDVFTRRCHIDYRVAVIMSLTLGALTNFVLSNAFVFDRKSLSLWHAAVRHYLASLGGLAVNEIVLIALLSGFKLSSQLVAKIIATGVAFFVNFAVMKMCAFNPDFRPGQWLLGALRPSKRPKETGGSLGSSTTTLRP